jgi:hypothetical protein
MRTDLPLKNGKFEDEREEAGLKILGGIYSLIRINQP